MPIRTPKIHREKSVIADAPSRKLDAIIKAGKTKAKSLGHNMVQWKMDHADGELRCTACRRLLYVAETPMPGGPNFGGPAVEEACA